MKNPIAIYFTLLLGLILCACGSYPEVSNGSYSASTIIGSEQIDLMSTDARAPKERVIYFDQNKSEILPKYIDIITQHAHHIILNRTGRKHIVGHTDNRGKHEFNVSLGDKRAKAVEHMMLVLGVNPAQLRTSSYGEEFPVDDNHDRNEMAWAKNRRAVILYDADITMEP